MKSLVLNNCAQDYKNKYLVTGDWSQSSSTFEPLEPQYMYQKT